MEESKMPVNHFAYLSDPTTEFGATVIPVGIQTVEDQSGMLPQLPLPLHFGSY